MAYTSSIDELNNLQTEQDKQKIRDYFEEMDLEPEEIEKRIGVANGLDNLYLMLFLLMSASATAGESVIDDNEYWNDYLTRGYNDVLGENGYDTDDPMVSGRIDETVNEVLNTTYEHIAQSYYLSHDRAVMIASNDTNAFANYEQHIQAIKAGYTRKRWVAMRDRKVRHTHVWADGQEADIQKPFIVGGYEMLFPLDQSLGADAKEVVNCRCICTYFGKNNTKTDAPIENEESRRAEFVEEFGIEPPTVNNEVYSDEFRKKIGALTDDIDEARNVTSALKSIYDHRNGTAYEDLAYIDASRDKVIINKDFDFYDKATKTSACKPNKAMDSLLNESGKGVIIGVHNHPQNNSPSVGDICCAYDRGYKYGIVGCHNGTIYKYSITQDFNVKEARNLESILVKLQKAVYHNSHKEIEDAINSLIKNGVHMEVW